MQPSLMRKSGSWVKRNLNPGERKFSLPAVRASRGAPKKDRRHNLHETLTPGLVAAYAAFLGRDLFRLQNHRPGTADRGRGHFSVRACGAVPVVDLAAVPPAGAARAGFCRVLLN